MANKGELDGVTYYADQMTEVEFDTFRAVAHEGDLLCVNRRCRTRMFLRRWCGIQQFVHYQSETSERCPESRGESQTHHDMKEALAAAGETLGLRAETEAPVGRRTVDVALYRPDVPSTDGLAFCLEAQNSPIDPAEFVERDRNHWEALNALHVPGESDRRAAAWFFNHDPTNLSHVAYLRVDRDNMDTVTGGIYPVNDVEAAPFVVPVDKTLKGLRSGGVWLQNDARAGIDRWVARRGLFDKAPRGKRPRGNARPDAVAGDCTRQGEVMAQCWWCRSVLPVSETWPWHGFRRMCVPCIRAYDHVGQPKR